MFFNVIVQFDGKTFKKKYKPTTNNNQGWCHLCVGGSRGEKRLCNCKDTCNRKSYFVEIKK